jgi:single-strand DNA-binding protein
MRNSVTLVGRPGAEPEMRNLNNNSKVARFRLAVTESRRNANHEWVNDTQWFNIVAWGAVAERVQKNVRKGQRLALAGSLRNNDWTDDKGQRHSSTEVWVNDLLLMDKGKD